MLFRFLLVTILILILIRLINRYLTSGSRRNFQNRSDDRDGEVRVNKSRQDKGGKFGDNYKGGDYIDYEEV